MAPIVGGINQLSEAISHATAPAFMLGAVAGFLSILIARLERIADRNRALRAAGEPAWIRRSGTRSPPRLRTGCAF